MAKGNGKKKPNGNGSSEAAKQSPNRKERSTEHLAPWKFKPGQSGNPKGRPKKPSLWDAVARKLRQAEVKAENGVERLDEDGKRQRSPTVDEVAEALLEMVVAGDREAATMLREMGDRLDGKVPLKAELTGADGDAIQVRHQRDAVLGRIGRLAEAFEAAADSGEPN